MARQIIFFYFSHEVQSFRRQLSKFGPISLLTFKVTEDRMSAEKVMASDFWDSSGKFFTDYLEKGKQTTVTIIVYYWTD